MKNFKNAVRLIIVLLYTAVLPVFTNSATITLSPAYQAVVVDEDIRIEIHMDFSNESTLGGGFDLFESSGLVGYQSFSFNPALGDQPLMRRQPAPSMGILKGFAFGQFEGLEGKHLVGVLTLKALAPGIFSPSLSDNDIPAGAFISATNFATQNVEYSGATVRIFESVSDLPTPSITVNSSNNQLALAKGSNLEVAFQLNPGLLANNPADWWIWTESPAGIYWWSPNTGWALSSEPLRAHAGELFNLSSTTLLTNSTMPPGDYTFHFAVDHNADGVFDGTYSSSQTVTIFEPIGTWSARAAMPTARFESGTAILNGNIFVVGGITEPTGASVNTMERYEPLTDSWVTLSPLPAPEPLNHVAIAAVGNRLFAIGGFNKDAIPVSSVYSYNAENGQWDVRASMPQPRGAVGIAVINGLIYVAGGSPATESKRFSVYDPNANQWAELQTMPTARDSLAAVAHDGRFYAISGRFNGMLQNATEVYDPATAQWSALTPIPTPRGGHAAAVSGNRFYVFGGEGNTAAGSNGVFPVVEEYDPALDTWAPVSEMPDGGRHGFGAVAHKGRIWLPGGAPVLGFGKSNRLDVYLPPSTNQGPFAYISNYNADTVSVIDTAHDIVTTRIPVGDAPRGVAVHPSGSAVYISNAVSSTVSVIDTAINSVSETISAGNGPNGASGIAVHPDGNTLYVTNLNDGTLHFIDTSSNTILDTVSVGNSPRGIAIHPNGNSLYVANSGSNSVSIVDTTSHVVTSLPVGNFPFGIAMNPNGNFAYITNDADGTVSVIDTSNNTITNTIAVGTFARGVAVHPDGSVIYVGTFADNSVVVIDTVDLQVVKTIPVSWGVTGVGVHPDGQSVYAANSGTKTVSVIDTESNSVREVILVDETPIALGLFITELEAE